MVHGHEEHHAGLGKYVEDHEEDPGEQELGPLGPEADQHEAGQEAHHEVAGCQDVGGYGQADWNRKGVRQGLMLAESDPNVV